MFRFNDHFLKLDRFLRFNFRLHVLLEQMLILTIITNSHKFSWLGMFSLFPHMLITHNKITKSTKIFKKKVPIFFLQDIFSTNPTWLSSLNKHILRLLFRLFSCWGYNLFWFFLIKKILQCLCFLFFLLYYNLSILYSLIYRL